MVIMGEVNFTFYKYFVPNISEDLNKHQYSVVMDLLLSNISEYVG